MRIEASPQFHMRNVFDQRNFDLHLTPLVAPRFRNLGQIRRLCSLDNGSMSPYDLFPRRRKLQAFNGVILAHDRTGMPLFGRSQMVVATGGNVRVARKRSFPGQESAASQRRIGFAQFSCRLGRRSGGTEPRRQRTSNGTQLIQDSDPGSPRSQTRCLDPRFREDHRGSVQPCQDRPHLWICREQLRRPSLAGDADGCR